MKSQLTEYAETSSSAVIEASETAHLAKLPPATQQEQWRQLIKETSDFWVQLPDSLSSFFNENKQLIINLALIVSALIALKVVLTVIVTLNDIPLIAPTFKLVGIGYSVWFVSRYGIVNLTHKQDDGNESAYDCLSMYARYRFPGEIISYCV